MRITFSKAPPGTVYRALRDDVPYPFVTISDGPGHDVIHEDGDTEGRGGVIVIERISDEAAWHELREALSTHRGYLGSRLFHGTDGSVAVSRWSSPLMYARATRERDIPWPSALYLSD